MKSFAKSSTALLTVMLQCETPEIAIERIKRANALGADAYGLQAEVLNPEHQNAKTFERIFYEMENRPCYATNYRGSKNAGKTDEQLADGLITLSKSGATLCDVMGDMFCRNPEELTTDETAVKKQMELIEKLHGFGSEVLISSHLYKYIPAERVLEIALEQKRRGADVIKIVTHANDMSQQLENLRITNLLKEELGAPFLFLSGGECSLHRKLGIKLGCCMALCVYEHDEFSTPVQPLLSEMKILRENL